MNKVKTKLFIVLALILFSCQPNNFDDNLRTFHQVYDPALRISKYDSLKIDLNNDACNDILLYVDSTEVDTNVMNGVYVTFINDTFYFSYGIRVWSSSFNLLSLNDEIDENLDWDSFLTLDGYIIYRGFLGKLKYLGIKHRKNDHWNYGWLMMETTDTTLYLYECFYSEKRETVRAGIIK